MVQAYPEAVKTVDKIRKKAGILKLSTAWKTTLSTTGSARFTEMTSCPCRDSDYKFQNIWNGFAQSCFIAMIFVVLNVAVPNFINTWTIVIFMALGTIFLVVNRCLSFRKGDKIGKLKQGIDIISHDLVIPVLCYALFAINQIPVNQR